MNNDPMPTKMLDAVHVELLTDVQKLRLEVKEFTEEIPKIYNSVKEDVEASSLEVKSTFNDFKSMTEALALHVNTNTKKTLNETKTVNDNLTNQITKTFEPYTKYFWLLIGITTLNSLLIFLLIAVLLISK